MDLEMGRNDCVCVRTSFFCARKKENEKVFVCLLFFYLNAKRTKNSLQKPDMESLFELLGCFPKC